MVIFLKNSLGTRPHLVHHLTLYYHDLNGISPDIFMLPFGKVGICKAYLLVHKTLDDLKISGYSSIQNNHPSNKKKRDVLKYYKNCQTAKEISITFLSERKGFYFKEKKNV